MELKGQFGNSDPIEATFGESKLKPAPSCSLVKQLTGSMTNGFYWIKNKCSKVSFKVYCKLNGTRSIGYIIENDHEFKGINVLKAHSIKTPELILKICSKNGFEVGSVKAINDFKVMSALALI